MPILIDSPAVPNPHATSLPGNVTIDLIMHSAGTGPTNATIQYSLAPANDVFIDDGVHQVKSVTSAAFAVAVPPGVQHRDALAVVRGAGTAVILLVVALEIQEVDAAGGPIGFSQHRNVVIQIT